MLLNQLPEESPQQFQIFEHYAKLGFARSITQLTDTFNCSRKHIHNLSSKFDWKKRILEYDDLILARIREDVNKEFQEVAVERRSSVLQAYGQTQGVFKKMLDYEFKYSSNTMEAEEFLGKTEKYFNIILKYDRISVRFESHLKEFGIYAKGTEKDLEDSFNELDQLENEVEAFIDDDKTENSSQEFPECEEVINTEANPNDNQINIEDIRKIDEKDLDHYINYDVSEEDLELTESEITEIEKIIDRELPNKQ